MTDFPQPLTPADCDLRGLSDFRLDVDRLLSSELMALSTGDEFKAAVRLWCHAWKQVPAASLPNDERVLSSFAGLPVARWRKLRAVAMRGFVLCSDGRFYHATLAAEALRASESKARSDVKREMDRKRLEAWRARQKNNSDATQDETRCVGGNPSGSPPVPSVEGSGSLRSPAPAAPSPPPPPPPVEDPKPAEGFDLERDMPPNLRRKPGDAPLSPNDQIWGPLRQALGLTDADRSFVGRLVKDHGEDAVCVAMAEAATGPLPADPKSWLKQRLSRGANGQAKQAESGRSAERVANAVAVLAARHGQAGADGVAPAVAAVLPTVPR